MLNYFEMAASQIGTIFRVPRENPELVEAKLAAFTRQVPMMYALVVVNTTALAITFYGTAPHLLTVYLPAAFDAICVIRILSWLRARNTTLSLNQAVEKLTGSIIFAGILGVAFTAWSLSLFPMATPMQSHVAFFMAVTSIGCGFCLMHLRAAALIVMALVVVLFRVLFRLQRQCRLRLHRLQLRRGYRGRSLHAARQLLRFREAGELGEGAAYQAG